jgi:hypothetical protein
MPAPQITPLPTPPSRSQSPETFSVDADAFLGALPEFQSDANAQADYLDALAVEVSDDATAAIAAAQAAIAGANVSEWVSGTTYAIGAVVYSPIDLQSYRRRVAGAGTIDPSLDGTNWQRFTNGIKGFLVRTANYTAANEDQIIANTSGGSFTITLPASPASGAEIFVADGANTWGTNNLTIARNGQTIAGFSTDMICDISGVNIRLIFNGTTWRVYTQIGANNGTAVSGPATSIGNTLVAFDGTSGRVLRGGIPAGTIGQVLTSQGAGQLPIYAPAPTSMIELIETRTISAAAQIDFTNLNSTYWYYMIVVPNLTLSVAGNLWLRTSTDNGTTFADAAGNYAYNSGVVTTSQSFSRTTAAQAIIGNISVNTNTASLNLTLLNMASATGFPQYMSQLIDMNATTINRTEAMGIRAAAGAVNAIRILPASGNITGVFKLYGVRA